MKNQSVDKRKPGTFSKYSGETFIIFLNFFIFFLLFHTFSYSGGLLSLDLHAHHYSDFGVALTVTLYSAGYILANLVLSKHFNDFTGKYVFFCLYSFLAVTMFAAPFCEASFLVYPLRFLWGIFSGMLFTLLLIAVIQHANPKRIAVVLAVVGVLAGLGATSGAFLVKVTGISGAMPYLLAGITLVIAFPLSFLFRIHKTKKEKHRTKDSLFAGILCLLTVPVLVILSISLGIGYSTSKFLTIYAEQFYHIIAKDAAVLLGVYSAGAVFISIPIGWLGDRFGPSKVIVAVSFVFSVLGFSLYYFNVFSDLLYPIFFLIGGSINALHSLLLAFMTNVVGKHDIPKAVSGFNILGKLGGIFGTLVLGALMTSYGAMSFLSILLASGLIIFISILFHLFWHQKKSTA
ncbi:MAG: MFS transporter [Alphaproteobacteria bacterium]|nr:MFS transporter [Alphaproteobacteria bacterium]MBT5389249.1 MFS transporter [Alphaproteobacteria bacterium]MBT5655185.1 MFS transporter [Alphaproteobacteria bacterium]